METHKLDQIINIIRSYLGEEAPTMNLGTGKIAGTPEADPGNPPVDKRKKKNNIFLGPKSRTAWIRNLRKK